MAPNPMEESEAEWRKLRDRIRGADAQVTREAEQLQQLFERVTSMQPRRLRECWTPQDDFAFEHGYRAWLMTSGPEGR